MGIYNQVNIILHHSVPFFINAMCTIILLVQIASHRSRAAKNKTCIEVFREQCVKQKELFIPALTTIISALPQFIISFSFACREMNNAWQRYALTIAYFVSYMPQILSFFIYVQPSSFYKSEFQLTKIGKLLRSLYRKEPT